MDHIQLFLVLSSLFSLVLSSSSDLSALDTLAEARLKRNNPSSCQSPTCFTNSTTSRSFLPNRCNFYVHDILNADEAGMNASAYVIAAPSPPLENNFGTLIAFDDKVTATPDYESPEIGRARGTYLVDNLTGRNASLLYEFTVTLYHIGTLCFMGQRPLELHVSTLGVFGCGGVYRTGTSLAEVSAVSFSPSGLNEVFHVHCLVERH